MTISVPLAQLTGTFLETFAYGIYIVIFPRCLDILRKRDVKRSLMSYLLATMWIGFVLITVHVVVDVVRAVQAFAGNMDVPGSPEKYYAIVNTALDRTKTSTYVSETLLADTLLVYRTYIVWGRKYWVVIVPILLLGSDAAMSVWFTWSINQASPGSSVLVSAAFARSKYFYIVTLALNLLCTFLIGFRIWKINHRLKSHSAGLNRKDHVLSAILESAAMYTASLIGLIGTSVADNSAMFLFLNAMPPVIGSVFSYVVIRCSMDNKRFDTHVTRNGLDNMHVRSGGVMVHLEQVVHHDMDPETEHDISQKSVESYV